MQNFQRDQIFLLDILSVFEHPEESSYCLNLRKLFRFAIMRPFQMNFLLICVPWYYLSRMETFPKCCQVPKCYHQDCKLEILFFFYQKFYPNMFIFSSFSRHSLKARSGPLKPGPLKPGPLKPEPLIK